MAPGSRPRRLQALWEAGARTFFVALLLAKARKLRDAAAGRRRSIVLNGLFAGTEATYREHALRPVLGSVPEIERWQQFCASAPARRCPPRCMSTPA